MKIHQLYKKVGQTPLEALEVFRKRKKISANAKLTYVGRLDPMAEGVLLVLEGATQEQREKYMGLPKAYEAEVLFGFRTDTFDVLGLPTPGAAEKLLDLKNINKFLKQYQGTVKLLVPAYSSVPVGGKPLFQWAREGKLKEVKIPEREMLIKKIKFLKFKNYKSPVLFSKISKKINKVNGDFRQDKAILRWEKLLKGNNQTYFSIKFIIHCESGTYIRSIANDFGEKLKIGALLFNLKRLRVGKFKTRPN